MADKLGRLCGLEIVALKPVVMARRSSLLTPHGLPPRLAATNRLRSLPVRWLYPPDNPMHDLRRRDAVLRTLFAANLTLAFAWLSWNSTIAWSSPSDRLTPIVRAVRDCSPAVVNIQGQKSISEAPDGTASAPRQVNGMGTGVVVDSRGYILTNHHVVEGVRRIKVTLSSGQTYIARLISHDKETDLAIIRIRTSSKLPTVRLGSSHDLMTGETVIAVGNAYGYEHTVTQGIISALHRNVQVNDTQEYLDLIQTDASINPGNSGGPLLNIDGEMIGVNVAVRAGAQGIGFAIPVNKALDVATRLLSIEKLDNHWHGMKTLSSNSPTSPVTVAHITRGSPAQQGGLRQGDLIERIGSTEIYRSMDVERALLGRRTGDHVPVVVRRDNETVELKLTLASRLGRRSGTSNSLADETWDTLGLELERAPRETFGGLDVPYEGGMRVVSVRPDSSAWEQGVREGDILVRMHRWTVTSEQDIRFIVSHADDLARAGAVKFYILRDGETTPLYGHMTIARRSSSSPR